MFRTRQTWIFRRPPERYRRVITWGVSDESLDRFRPRNQLPVFFKRSLFTRKLFLLTSEKTDMFVLHSPCICARERITFQRVHGSVLARKLKEKFSNKLQILLPQY